MIRWRIHLAAPPPEVWTLLATDAGRARFWAESAAQHGDGIRFTFPNGLAWTAEVLEWVDGERLGVRYLGGSRATFAITTDGRGGTDLELTDDGVSASDVAETSAGWVSVLLALKAAADFGVDLRNHDPKRTWDEGYCDN